MPFLTQWRFPWALWNRPVRHCLLITCVVWILGMIRPRTNNFRSWVHKNQRIKSFNCSSSIQTKLWWSFRLWMYSRIILRSWSHLVFFLINRKSRSTSKSSTTKIPSSNFISLICIELDIKYIYIDIFSEIMLILCLRVQSISRICAYFVLRTLIVLEFIRWIVSWTFWSLFAFVKRSIP